MCRKVHQTILDEGASTSVFSMSFWRAIGSPKLNKSQATLKAFDRRGFQPHELLSTISIEMGGKTISIQVEVIDAPLDYNLLLGRNWFYAMMFIALSVFCTLRFPYQGNICDLT